MGEDPGWVRRWRRYGHDRLYVTGPDGAALGYMDAITGRACGVPAGRSEEFHAALAAYHVGTGPGRARPGAQAPAQRVAPPSFGGSGTAPDLVGMPIPPPRTPADGQARSAATEVPGPPAHRGLDGDRASDLEAPLGGPSAAGPVVEPGPPCAGEGYDLAAHRPGQAAAEVAAELRAAAPVRSLLARLFGLHTRERAWRVGAAGERITAGYLRRLTDPWWARLAGRTPRWHVLHAIPIGTRGADIDHVVLGPTGVVTVNTKHHPGATVWVGDHVVTVNGATTLYARKAFAEATRAARLLTAAAGGEPVSVRPVIAVVGARVTGRRQTRDGVLVVSAQQLPRALRRGHRTLPDQRVHELYVVARRSETWRG